jgi:DNA polymerase II large subunit
MRPEDEQYFGRLEALLDDAFDTARAARARGYDPEPEVEIPVAKDMADRVENILGIDGVAELVREYEAEMSREEAALALAADFAEGRVGDYESRAGKVEGAVRTAVALLTEGVVAAPIEGIDRVEILENDDGSEFVNVYYAGPIRSAGGTAQALSVLVADYTRTLVGLSEFRARDDEIERYAEEITLYDKETGLQYTPKDKETTFIAEHMPIMLDGEATSDEEVSGFRDLDRVDTNSARGGMCLVLAEGIALKAPKIQRYTRELDEVDWPWLQDLIDGTIGKDAGDDHDAEADEGDGDGDGNGDGAEDPGGGDGDGAEDADDEPAGPPRVEPSKKYLRDLIAGRPVFGHPSKPGGFRLRYGRARNHGFATAGVHPATMHVVDDFLATGTQIKTERPGKAAGVVPVDTIDGPTVRLANGDVRRLDTAAEALAVRNGIEAVIDLGEYLVNYGEFVENNHPLAPAGYTVEWWRQEFAATGADVQALRDDPHVDLVDPPAADALAWATEYDAPLHPTYTYLWHDLPVEGFETLAAAVATGRIDGTDDGSGNGNGNGTGRGGPSGASRRQGQRQGQAHGPDAAESGTHGATADGVLVIERTPATREALEVLLVEHTQTDETLRVPDWRPLARQLGIDDDLEPTWAVDATVETDVGEDDATGGGTDDPATGAGDGEVPATDGGVGTVGGDREPLSAAARTYDDGNSSMRAVREVAPFAVRERAPTRIGNRMGRPEKSETRELSPAVHTLFPIGEAGGSQRDVAAAARSTTGPDGEPLVVQVGDRQCPDCGTHTHTPACPDCGGHTDPYYECDDCGRVVDPDDSGRVYCDHCEWEVSSVHDVPMELKETFDEALAAVGERETAFDILKGVKGLTSATKTPEPLEKGILRAKNGVSAFKDGTVRYDMTDLPVTSVRPEELDVTADHFRELGYDTDVDGEPLRFDDQLVELKVQDIVLSDGAAEHMLRTADYVDDLLEQFYDLPAFYELNERDDLVGELVFGMAPHTSAATVGRIVGFTSAAVGYAHPYFHAAKRRNCFHPETSLAYEAADGSVREASIKAIVERHLAAADAGDRREDALGTVVAAPDDELRVPSVDEDGRTCRQPVTAVSRHPAPEHLLEFTTETGRQLRVTPEHTMLRWTGDDRLERVAASELAVGDGVPIYAGATAAERVETDRARPVPDGGRGFAGVDTITDIAHIDPDVEFTYCLEVDTTNTVRVNDVYTSQCDGDEDCVMLLMDGLINFSKSFLPDQRGGKMDAPLVMSSRIDPSEIDDEAHNMDIVREYPREFYEATRELADPGAVEDLVTIAEETLGTDREYTGFSHTHDTTDIHQGPALSAYKTLGSMMDKMDAQLELSRKLRSVDETDVAERVIEYHFLPDLIGNLRAFARQETRCLDCGEKYRRMPLTGDCRECGGRVNLTVHKGSVNKYMDVAIQVAEEFGCRDYTKQRLEVLERSLERIFENDHNKQSGIADFM